LGHAAAKICERKHDLLPSGEGVGKGHSALLALVGDGMVGAVLKAAQDSQPKTMRTNLSKEDEQVLQTIFLTSRE